MIVNAHFNELTPLRLLAWPLRVVAGNFVSGCMPELHHMNVFVIASQPQSCINLANLHTLTLNILQFEGLHNQERLEVHDASNLTVCFLYLKHASSETSNLTLLMNNANVQFRTEGIDAVATPLTNVDWDKFDLRIFHELP